MIVLLGDYSSVHFELSKALKDKGVDVLLLSDGDDYKNIGCDIKLPSLKRYKNKWVNKVFYFFRFSGLFGLLSYFDVKKEIERINNISVVQVINPVVIEALGALGNILLIRYLRKKSVVLSLCALGDDYHWAKSCLSGKYKYSAMDRIFDSGFKGFFKYMYTLRYIFSPAYRLLDWYAREKSNLIIPGLMDYKIAYSGNDKITDIISLPISPKRFSEPKKTEYPVRVCHAWQIGKENKKGNDVLDLVVKKYISIHGTDKVKYNIISGLAYDEYLKRYNEADIVLDQMYSYDRGVTGALGMAAGKVVFSGFEEGDGEIGINATPDMEKLYFDFSKLIESLDSIDKIKHNAYEYSLKRYKSDHVCDLYLEAWSDCIKNVSHKVLTRL